PYNAISVYTRSSRKTYSKRVDYIHSELRSAFELTHLFENYSLSLLESTNLHVTLIYNSNQTQQELNSNIEETFDLYFTTINNTFLSIAHQILNRKLVLFLNQTHSLKQFIRLLHMTANPLSSIARLNCFNRPIPFVNRIS
ncbi:unnamed protein product, partial [Rotaria sordida]